MEISDIVDKNSDFKDFISSNFEKVNYKVFEYPVHPFNVQFINKTEDLRFCTANIEQCWVKKIDTFYAFFIIFKTGADIKKIYRKGMEFAMFPDPLLLMDSRSAMECFCGEGGVNIDLTSYFNILRIPKFELCDLIICGNMNKRQLTYRMGK